MSESPRTAVIAAGGIHLLNGTAPLAPDEPIALIRVPVLESVVPSNTIVVDWAALGSCDVVVLALDGSSRQQTRIDGADLFPTGRVGPVLRQLLGTSTAVAPLSYLSEADGGGFYVHGQVRFLAEDACFIRIIADPVGAGAVEELHWLRPALAAHAEHALFLNNHQRYYQKCFPGLELEYKYTLDPAPDIWELTLELLHRVRSGHLDGYILEYRDEFQAWDYGNHLFEVTDPEPERGYVSFIPTTDGRQMMKRKWFAEDSFARRETHTYGLTVEPSDYSRYIRDELKVKIRPLPAFRRVRYDVNFESVRTGHVYGIFFDHCSLDADSSVVLSQCELEYLRTRSPLPADESVVLAEMEQLALWLEAYLAEHGLANERSFYSKRSFLQDAVARYPELALADPETVPS